MWKTVIRCPNGRWKVGGKQNSPNIPPGSEVYRVPADSHSKAKVAAKRLRADRIKAEREMQK